MSYSIDDLKNAVISSSSISEVLRRLNLNISGTSYKYMKIKIDSNNIDCSHFKKYKPKPPIKTKVTKNYLVYDVNIKNRISGEVLTKALIKYGRVYHCVKCNNDGIWQNEKLKLEIHHIDGNWKNNEASNLMFLCPNCHSLTSNFYNNGKRCKNCNNKCTSKSNYCMKCSRLFKKYLKKIDISKEELEKIVWQFPTTYIAKMYNVSDTLIGKLCKKFKIKKPPRGYWTKIRKNNI